MQMSFDEFIAYARRQKNFRDLGRKPTSGEVSQISQVLSIELPATYRTLVEAHGFVRWFGNSVFGVDPEGEESTLMRTLEERDSLAGNPTRFAPLPENGNIIGEIFGGGFCFLHAENSLRPGEVSAHAPDEEYKEVQFWRTIDDYFEYLVHRVPNWLPT